MIAQLKAIESVEPFNAVVPTVRDGWDYFLRFIVFGIWNYYHVSLQVSFLRHESSSFLIQFGIFRATIAVLVPEIT